MTRDDTIDDSAAGRPVCLRCLKAVKTCYCKRIRSLRSGAEVVLLQHPREFRKSIGTGRMTHLCLENSRLIVGAEFNGVQQVDDLIDDPTRQCWVLYPGADSYNISERSSAELAQTFSGGRQHVIFVIDGTWPCARKMLSRSANLAGLPRLSFNWDQDSEYQIRRQPSRHCLSSLEAVHTLLAILEPATDASILLELFRSMVSEQILCSEVNSAGGKRSERNWRAASTKTPVSEI